MLLTGLVLMAAGLVVLGRVTPDSSYLADLLPALLVMGVGFGLAMPALMALGMSDARPEDTGLASGLFNTTQQVAGALGLSALAVLAATRADALGGATAEALTSGYRLAFWVAAGLVAAGAVVAGFVFAPRRGAATR